MQCQRLLCTIFLSISIVVDVPLVPKALAIAQDPDPVVTFEHKKGGYGDYLAAVFAARTDDNMSAASLYSNVLSQNPTDEKLRRMTFYHGVLSGNDIAVKLASSVKDPIADLVLANDAIVKGQWENALKYFSNPPGDAFSQMTYPLLRAWCLYGAGQKEAAFALLSQASQHSPIAGLYLLHEAMMYALDHQDQKAGILFEKADKLFPGVDLLLVQTYGHWLVQHNRVGKADAMVDSLVDNLPFLLVSKKDLQNSLKQLPIQNAQQAIAQVYLAMASLIQQELVSQSGDDDDQTIANKVALHTEQIFLRFALKLNPDLSTAKIMLSTILAQDKNLTAAKDVLLPVASNDSLKTVIELRVARLNALTDSSLQAEKELKSLLITYPESADIWQALADLYFDQKNYKAAAETYTKVISLTKNLNNTMWPVYFARAIAYEKLGQWDKAEKDLRQALDFAPNEPMLLNYLGYSWALRKHNLKQAQILLQKAIDIAPKEGAIRDSLGWAMLMNGDVGEAVKQLEKASETIPQDPELNYHLGVAYWKDGRYQEAVNQWNVALTCSPAPDVKELILKALQNVKENGFPNPVRQKKR
ncbi:tetratricopeptide repeat protein [Commensalibacter oyaizuii]|uniref:Tetratricopeptide repeat protein n=1 Tax=Commensalibacter oyaizuii TaxID=3043873 RepID=A0ABT6Q379_9PROT|nr:tetratricopeptide repeat protein [Commensalibacter sp. TBRC 16381]MDI2090959.1 tetratricopeptide repeat protein [Commensalibacter sp. TBRC 16381]